MNYELKHTQGQWVIGSEDNASAEIDMFFSEVWNKAHGILFLKGRLHFHMQNGDRAKANAGAPSCLIAYGEDNAEALKVSDIPRRFIYLK